MGPMTNYPSGFAQGIAIRGLPITQSHPGKVFYVAKSGLPTLVNQKDGSDGNDGSFNAPFATIQKAINSCTASRGDIIFVKPGHTESVAAAGDIALSTAGVAILGLGAGALRPTITYTTANTAAITVTAANCSVSNLLLVANFAAIGAAFTVTAKDFTCHNCEFRDTTSILNFKRLFNASGADNTADGLWVSDNVAPLLGATASSVMVETAGDLARLAVKNNYYQNLCVTDLGKALNILTTKKCLGLVMTGNIFDTAGVSSATGGTIIFTDTSTNTGYLANNYVFNLDATTEILVTASSGLRFFENKSAGAADKSGYLLPAADS